MVIITKNKEEIEKEILTLIKTGKAKQVDLSLFDDIYNLKINTDTFLLAKDVLELYKQYLNIIKKFKDMERYFLLALKENDIIKNHELENVPSIVTSMYLKAKFPSAIDKLIKDKEKNKIHTKADFIKVHKLLVSWLEDDQNLRTDNTSYVGNNINGIRSINYIPIDYKFIPSAINEILAIYNNDNINNEEDILIKPIIIHGLIAALQCFRDGNTRLSRVYQHVMLWNYTNKYIDPICHPALYTSESISIMDNYRDLITDLAINSSNDTWNKWILNILLRFEKQIYINQDNIGEISRVFKFK